LGKTLSPYLLPVQEKAVRDYGALENEGGMDSHFHGNDIEEDGFDESNP